MKFDKKDLVKLGLGLLDLADMVADEISKEKSKMEEKLKQEKEKTKKEEQRTATLEDILKVLNPNTDNDDDCDCSTCKDVTCEHNTASKKEDPTAEKIKEYFKEAGMNVEVFDVSDIEKLKDALKKKEDKPEAEKKPETEENQTGDSIAFGLSSVQKILKSFIESRQITIEEAHAKYFPDMSIFILKFIEAEGINNIAVKDLVYLLDRLDCEILVKGK